MIFSIILIAGIYLLLPASFLYSLWKGAVHSRLEWFVKLLSIIMFFVWIFFSGRWDWVGYYLRWIWPILLLPAVYVSWKKTRSLPFRSAYDGKQKGSIVIYAILTLIFGLYNVNVLRSYPAADEAIELSFSL